MKALKFSIQGMTAFFKNPDINQGTGDMWFSFPHIHKVALSGICGALLGYDGYRNQKDNEFPEFWEKFKNQKIAIVPDKPIFKKRKVETTNTVGYGNQKSKEAQTMISNEYWLEGIVGSPLKWTIFIQDDGSDFFKELCNTILNNNMVYTPYLGNNHHFADIKDAAIVELSNTDSKKVDSLFLTGKNVSVEAPKWRSKNIYVQYFAPIKLNSKNGQYVYKQHVLTNRMVNGIDIFTDGNFNITFI